VLLFSAKARMDQSQSVMTKITDMQVKLYNLNKFQILCKNIFNTIKNPDI